MVAPIDAVDAFDASGSTSTMDPQQQQQQQRGAGAAALVLVQSEQQLIALRGGQGLCVIDFFADWCGPCRAIAGKYADLPAQFPGVTFAKANIEALPQRAVKDVAALPTFQLWRGGVLVQSVQGADIERVKDAIRAAL